MYQQFVPNLFPSPEKNDEHNLHVTLWLFEQVFQRQSVINHQFSKGICLFLAKLSIIPCIVRSLCPRTMRITIHPSFPRNIYHFMCKSAAFKCQSNCLQISPLRPLTRGASFRERNEAIIRKHAQLWTPRRWWFTGMHECMVSENEIWLALIFCNIFASFFRRVHKKNGCCYIVAVAHV